MKHTAIVLLALLAGFFRPAFAQEKNVPAEVILSQDLATAYYTGIGFEDVRKLFEEIDLYQMSTLLDTDELKKVFWLNVYVVNAQIIISMQEGETCNTPCRNKPQINIGGQLFSLNDIANGILRKKKTKFTKKEWGKRLPVMQVDPRVHFVIDLQTPEILEQLPFEPGKLNAQLDAIAKAYFKLHAIYSAEENRVTLERWISVVKGDFGNHEGLIAMMKKYGFIPEDSNPAIFYTEKIVNE